MVRSIKNVSNLVTSLSQNYRAALTTTYMYHQRNENVYGIHSKGHAFLKVSRAAQSAVGSKTHKLRQADSPRIARQFLGLWLCIEYVPH